jgi:predicted SAM-dependent methyltransferase
MKKYIQVNQEHYQSDLYDTRERFISYWYQANQVLKRRPMQVLEIGIGNGFLNRYLKSRGLIVNSVDIDIKLSPNVVGSVLHLPFFDSVIDMVICFEVLEHLPWKELPMAVSELNRVAKRWVLLSVPDITPCVRFGLGTTVRQRLSRIYELPYLAQRPHVFNGEHYWELGKNGFTRTQFYKILTSKRLYVEENFRIYDFPYHHFYSCRC